MEEASEWLELLRGQLPAQKARKLKSKGIKDLDKFLKCDPQTEQRVVDILSRRLNGEINADTWNIMHASLSQYFTEDLAYLLYWVVGVEDPTANRMQEIEKSATPQVMAFLRAVVGIFGVDLSRAFVCWNQMPNNWRTIKREVFHDLINDQYLLRIRIVKYNGEETLFEGPADFILNLSAALNYTASMLGIREAFSEEAIQLYLSDTKRLIEILTAEEEEIPAEKAKAKKS